MTEKNEIFIQIKGIGFTFLLDKRIEHNLVSPALLSFFSLGKRRMHSLPENNIREVNTNDNAFPFLPVYMNSISTNDVFHYVGRETGRCKDNKLRECRVFRFGFENEGCPFSFPFLLDKSLDEPAILGRESLNHIIKVMMKHKTET